MNGLKEMNKKKPHIVTIFGGTGDLTYRKLLPAFYNLYRSDNLPSSFHIVIIGRKNFTTETYRNNLKSWLAKHSRFKVEDNDLNLFLETIDYFEMTFTENEGYERLSQFFKELDTQKNCIHHKLFYFAVSPSFFIPIAEKLDSYDLAKNSNIIIEKPFGNDLASAIEINNVLGRIFEEDNIYRIDHYIAKEMVQNILTIRFANRLFSQNWDNTMIDNIQITAAETVGVESRGNFYDSVGALKDMFQSHLLQILSIVTMDKPLSNKAKDIHHAQEEILSNLIIKDPTSDLVYGQYNANAKSLAYRQEVKVDPDSKTETFVAMKLYIDNNNWQGVPIFVRTGKRMHKRSTEVAVQMKNEFGEKPNVLLIKIQPDEGVYLRLNIKRPGQTNETETVFMDYCQSCNYDFRINTPEAYERLLDASMNEDPTLFASFKQVEQSWHFTEELIDKTKDNELHFYDAYTDGPEAAHILLEECDTQWFDEKVLGDVFED